jgi:hypothetical protein
VTWFLKICIEIGHPPEVLGKMKKPYRTLINKFYAVTACSLFSLSAHSNGIVDPNVLLEVDIADLSAVTISATGAMPSQNASGLNLLNGVSLLDLFIEDESNPNFVSGNLIANGTTLAYSRAFTLPSDTDLNLWRSGPGRLQNQIFDTMLPAFTGMLTVDLTGYSIQSAGTYGDVWYGDSNDNGPILGQWEIVDSSAIPEPAMASLLCFGLVGLGLARRKNHLPS